MLSIGVDIGTFSIKIAEVEATSKSYVIRRVLEMPLSLDLTKDRKIQVIDALRTLFAQYDLDKTQFVFSLPQKMVSSRLLSLPFKERFKVQKALVPMLEDELPMTLEDAVFEGKVVRTIGKGAEVLAMAVPRERIVEVLNLAHDCGVEPSLISTDGVGLSNLFEKWSEPPPEGLAPEQEVPAPRNAELLVHIGHTSTELMVLREGALLGVYNIDFGGKNLADALGQRYGLNYIQAMRELQTKGFILLDRGQGSQEQVAFSQTLEASLQSLISELRLKLLELQSEYNLNWTKGMVAGGGAQLKNLNGFLTQHFQIPFSRFKQFESHPPINFEMTAHLEAVSAVAVGLAIEALRRPRNPAINFVKGDLAKQAHVLQAVWEKWGYTAQIGAAAFVLLFIYAMMRDSLATLLLDESEKALKTQAKAVADINPRQASASRIRKFIAAQEALEKGRKQAEKVLRLNSALDIVEQISSSLPKSPKLEIKRVSVQNQDAEVHGIAGSDYDKDTVGKMLARVANGPVSPVTSRVQAPAGRVSFGFKFKVTRGG